MRKVSRKQAPIPKILLGDEARAAREALSNHYRMPANDRRRRSPPLDESIWNTEIVRDALSRVFDSKCAYCESSLMPSVSWSVEHHRPTSEARGFNDRTSSTEHYGWFAYEWENLFPACVECSRHKQSYFPVAGPRAGVRSAWSEAEAVEKALLINPCSSEPRRHLRFWFDGVVSGVNESGLVVPKPRKRRYASYLGEISPAPENLINRNFQAAVPNEKWLTDITEFQIPAGKVYLSPIIDCFDGMVVSWTIGTSPDAELVNTMLDAAIETVAETTDRPVVHSDRGGHYRWPGWLSRMSDANFTRSMSRKACSPDNAACEGFFGRLKNELFYPRDWKNATIEQFIAAVDSYIRWYNEKRIKISLGSLSPIEYRESLGLTA